MLGHILLQQYTLVRMRVPIRVQLALLVLLTALGALAVICIAIVRIAQGMGLGRLADLEYSGRTTTSL